MSAADSITLYTCFGLTLQSPISLPLVVSTPDDQPDVVIHLAPPTEQQQEQPFRYFSDDFGLSRITVAPAGVGQFTLSNGTDIFFQPDVSGKFSSYVDLYLTGSVLSLLLYQRGLLVLHGSVLSIHNKAVVFLGHSGAGKSSAAAACWQRGHSLLADDIAAITQSDRGSWIQSGFPRLKIHVRTVEALGIPFSFLTAVHSDIDDEFALVPGDTFCTAPVQPAALYLLAKGEEMKIEQLSPAKALIELLQHTVPSRYGHNGGAHQFKQLSVLVEQVPVFRLFRPEDIGQLCDLPIRVEQHLDEL